jgi:putative nucleotidyltransferase with HDIG domain
MVQTSSSFRQDSRSFDGPIFLSEVVSALSYALDLTEGASHGHALRSCLVGMRIAHELQLSQEQMNALYYSLLLKDVAGSHSNYDDGLSGVAPHCDRGASIVSKLGMGALAAEAVRFADERWDGSGHPDRLRGEQIPLLSRICAIARHLDMFSSGRGAQSAVESLREHSGTWFDPDLVGVASALHRKGMLWLNCSASDSEHMRLAVLGLDPSRRTRLAAAEIDQVCEAFADVVDAKSHFTFSHSVGVADAAFGIAQGLGLSTERVQMVRRAALLHDIGKLSVSNSILDKTSDLNAREWQMVHQHPGYTRRILERIGPFREIAVIAGEHHEKLDGSGYPNRLMASDLSLESRIIAVADVYGALSENRPYRAGLELDAIVPLMKSLAPLKLDPRCVEALVAAVSSSMMKFSPTMYSESSQLAYAVGA